MPGQGALTWRPTPPDANFDWVKSLNNFRAGGGRPVVLDQQRALAISEQKADLVAEIVASADQYADGHFQFFGYPSVALPQPIDWNYDPISSVRWSHAPSQRIDHRVARGDVKWIWELNRLQHLPTLAQGWLFTGDERYSRAAFEHLDTWIEQNPPGRGIAWRGAFEAGIRAISITVALQGLRDSPELTIERYRSAVTVLAASADRCWRERSLYSSANNHLIGEMAGLAVVAMSFPDLASSAQWEQRAVQILTAEADKLILADGAGAEQSVGYQIATVELLHLVAALLVQRDGQAPGAITSAIARSSTFLAGLVGEHDPDPRYGDSDQEFALRLGAERVRTIREHLAIMATLGRSRGRDVGTRSLTVEWYRSMQLSTRADQFRTETDPKTALIPPDFFAEVGGLVVIRRGGRRITMDVGPLGYLSIAAHGHADALSVTLSDDEGDLIGDPGTGSYYRHPQWRAVMRGTRAHSTVCVDGENQSLIGGPFLWSQHARTLVRGVDLPAGVVDAEHDGYSRLPGRVLHRRWLVAPPEERTVLIVDLVTGEGVHEVRTSWPLHPSIDALSIEKGHTLTRRGTAVLQLLQAGTTQLVADDRFADDEEAVGWWSDLLESRTPSWWLGAVCHAELPIAIATLITPGDGRRTTGLEVALGSGEIHVEWMEDTKARGVAIRSGGSADVVYK